jgi:RHS repeat-associated protein
MSQGAYDETTNRLGTSSGLFEYDSNGNLTKMSPETLAYDAENRQTKVSSVSDTATYTYDGDGRRVTKTAGGNTTTYVYDAAGELAAEYVTVAQSADCTTCYLTTDPLGSTRVITDGNGNVVSRHDYYPFGEELATSNRTSALQYGVTDYVAQRFTGKERDSESGLDYFGARYMSSAQGRFTSPDPFGGHIEDPQTLNRYGYGRNNPLRYTDSTGLDFYLDCKEKSDTCQGGRVGTTDDKGKFTATQISNDKNGGLVDQNGNQYTGNFDQHGVHFTDSNGTDYSGRFAANTAATTLGGSGIFSGFTGAFNGNGLNTNIAQGSLFGSPQAFQALLKNLVGPNVGLDALNGFHPGTIQYRGGNDNGPDPHLSFDKSHLPDENGQIFQPFHFDGAYPFGDVSGFVQHTSSVFKNLFETQILRQKDVSAPLSIPH